MNNYELKIKGQFKGEEEFDETIFVGDYIGTLIELDSFKNLFRKKAIEESNELFEKEYKEYYKGVCNTCMIELTMKEI